jgi:ketosteroid isomerase-like protein
MTSLQSATASAVTVPPAPGANAMAEEFAAARLAAFSRGDVDALVAQYTDTAIVITPQGRLEGCDQIRGMIEGIIAEFGRPGVSFELLSQHAVGPIVAFTWKAKTAANDYHLGAETYVLEAGLAAYQTFAASVTPR